MKLFRLFMFAVLVCGVAPLQSTVRGGFGKMWDGVKDVASGSWEVVTSPFRRDDKKYEKTKSKAKVEDEKEVEIRNEK